MNTNLFLLIFMCTSLKFFAMENDQIIKGAGCYIFLKGGILIGHGVDGKVTNEQIPNKVIFFGKDLSSQIKCIEIDSPYLSTEQEKKFDAMVDPEVSSKINLYKVSISPSWKAGRAIGLYDKNNKWVAGHRYFGSADVKSLKARKKLLKPTSLLDSIKIVEEEIFFIWPFLSWPYQRIIYQDNGSKKIEISKEHRLIQVGVSLSSLGCLYVIYKSWFK